MATYFARKSGNINANDVWATTPTGTAGPVTFNNTDVLLANSFTITINVSTTVAEVRVDTTGGATVGGVFELSNGVVLTSNVFSNAVTNGICVNLATGSATINGNISGGSGTNATGARNNGTGTLTIVGNITGGSAAGSGASGVTNNQSGSINITGTITGGSVSTNQGVVNGGSGSVVVNGNVVGGSGNNCHGIQGTGGTVTITGNVSGGSTSADGVRLTGSGSITIIGNVVGGSVSTSAFGVQNTGTGTITIIGTATGSAIAAGANNNSTGTLIVTRAKGNAFGNGSVGSNSVVGINSAQNATTRVYEIEYGDLGQSPTSGPIQLIESSSNVCLVYRTGGLSKKTLIDAAVANGAFPLNADVRSGISYNNGNSIGSMNVPAANSVAFGVPVDDTTGTAVLTPSNVWDYLTTNINTSNSIGERLKNCSTIASVGQQLSNSLD